MKNTLFLVITVLLLNACSKTEHIDGRLVDGLSGEGISDVLVTVYVQTNFKERKEIASTITDKKGYFNIDASIFNSRSIFLKYEAEKLSNYIPKNSINENGNLYDKNVTDVIFFPKAFFKLKINGQNCTDNNGYIQIVQFSPMLNSGGSNFTIYNCQSYNPSEFTECVAGERTIRWEVKKNGLVTHYFITIFLEAHQNNEYEIVY